MKKFKGLDRKTVLTIGRIGSVLSVLMYVSYIPQIMVIRFSRWLLQLIARSGYFMQFLVKRKIGRYSRLIFQELFLD